LDLAALGVFPGATLEVLPRLRGGAQCGKMVKGRSKEKDTNSDLAAKLRWLQEQAEKRKIARDMLNAQRERAKLEQGLTNKNMMKILAANRQMMRDAKLAELEKLLAILAALHEEAVKRKDGIIARLLDNLDFAADQHTAAAMSHMDHLERLIRLQDQRLLLIERQFEADLKVLVDEFDDERDDATAGHRDEMLELTAINGMIEKEEKDEEDQAVGELQTLKQECREKREDAIDDLRSVLDGRLELIQDSFENAHLEYLERTDKRVSDFKHYTKINREREKDIERSVRLIERLQVQMQEVRNNMHLSGRKFEEQRTLLSTEKAAIQEQVSDLREKMRKFQSEQRSRRGSLAKCADQSKEALETQIKLGERILGLGEMARKKETEREKVQPFKALSTESDQMDHEVRAAGEVEPSNILEDKHPLANFHVKFNKALADKLVVENERNRLASENEQLMSLLKQVQDGLVVNDEVLGRANPLFVLNGRSSLQAEDPLPVEQAAPMQIQATPAQAMGAAVAS